MITFPNAKINLGLNITGKRPDGLHNIETIMVPVPLCDALEIVPSTDQHFHFSTSGLTIEGNQNQNLCVRAWQLLDKFVHLPAVSMHLHKCIPMGAGMGGGSSDGAFALQMLNKLFQVGLPGEQMMQLASQLGNDCPFFLINQPCYASGTGTQLQEVSPELSDLYLIIVKPSISVNTAWAYSRVKLLAQHKAPMEILQLPVPEWKGCLVNEFEEVVFERFPEIGVIKDQLYEHGASYASMSGSGSAVFGIFMQPVSGIKNLFSNCFVWEGTFGKS